METAQQVIERLRKADEAAAAEDAKRLAAIKQKYAEQRQLEADLRAKAQAKQDEERKAESEARLKSEIRSGYSLLSDEEFDKVYGDLRIAGLMRRSQETRQQIAQQIAQQTLHAFSV